MLEDTWKQRACCGVCGAIRGNKLAVCPARHMYMRILSLGFGGWARTLFRHCTHPAGHPSQDDGSMILRKVRKTEASPFAGLNGTAGEGFSADLQFFEFIDNPSRSVNQSDFRQGPRTQAVKVSNPWHPDAAPPIGVRQLPGASGQDRVTPAECGQAQGQKQAQDPPSVLSLVPFKPYLHVDWGIINLVQRTCHFPRLPAGWRVSTTGLSTRVEMTEVVVSVLLPS